MSALRTLGLASILALFSSTWSFPSPTEVWAADNLSSTEADQVRLICDALVPHERKRCLETGTAALASEKHSMVFSRVHLGDCVRQ